MFICPNRVKQASAVIILTISLLIVGFGVYFFIEWKFYTSIFKLQGGTYLPNLLIDYKSFSDLILYCSIVCALVFLSSMAGAYFKKPYLSFTLIIFALVAGSMQVYSSLIIGNFNLTTDTIYRQICSNSTYPQQIQQNLDNLVNQWMCTSTCKCFPGDDGSSVIQLWQSYDNSTVKGYGRNTGNINELNILNKTTFPFKWASAKQNSIFNYQQCYSNILVPENKLQNYKSQVDQFFTSGGYYFLADLENQFSNCASICQINLFYLQKDISLGMPVRECLRPFLDTAVEKGKFLSLILLIGGIACFSLIPFVFPICSDYHMDKTLTDIHQQLEDLELKKLGDQQVGFSDMSKVKEKDIFDEQNQTSYNLKQQNSAVEISKREIGL